jgi:hypothetical protein
LHSQGVEFVQGPVSRCRRGNIKQRLGDARGLGLVARAHDFQVEGAGDQPAAREDLIARDPARWCPCPMHRGLIHQRRAADHPSIDSNRFAG